MTKIKNILFAIMALFILHGCTDDSANNPVFADDEMPVIFGTWQSTIAVQYGDTIVFDLQISPSEGATYKWMLDGEIISTEKKLAHEVIESTGEHTLYFEVDRNGVKNSRTATVLVTKPFVEKIYNKKSIAYISVNGSLTDIQWDHITHLVVTSSQIKADGTPDFTLGGTTLNISTLISTAHNYGVYVLLEYSGILSSYVNGAPEYASYNFYNTAINSSTRTTLITSMLNFAVENKFDGINIYMDKAADGVFANPDELKVFYEELAAAVPEQGSVGKFYLSMSVYSGWTSASLAGVVKIERYDWINVLAFGAEDLTPTAHSALWYAASETQSWVDLGVAPEKIVLAVPAFGLRYFGDTSGYTWGNLWEFTEYIGYRTICNNYPDAHNANKIEIDNGLFYDGLADIEAKATFVIEKGYAGMALWSIENDSKDTAKSLIKRMNTSLGN